MGTISPFTTPGRAIPTRLSGRYDQDEKDLSLNGYNIERDHAHDLENTLEKV